jgi:hypothetical protein
VTPLVRLRRHSDGRLAVFRDGMWLITSVPPVTSYPTWFHDDRLCSGDDWSELLVAELPEPDGHLDDVPYWSSGHNTLPSWVAYPNLVEGENGVMGDPDELRSDALKMLAAVAACEQYRASRRPEGTPG